MVLEALRVTAASTEPTGALEHAHGLVTAPYEDLQALGDRQLVGELARLSR